MERDDQQRGQYERQYEQYSSSRGFGQNPRGGMGSSGSDRFRQTQISALRSPTAVPRTSAGIPSQGVAAYGYTQGTSPYAPQLQDNSLPYQPDFPQDPQRQQQYPSYTSNLMYNLPSQSQQQTAYDPVQQYQPRQSAAVELSSEFGVPQYYNTSEPTSVPGPMSQQFASAQFQPQLSYQNPVPSGRVTLPSSYSTGMADYVTPSVPDALEPLGQSQEPSGYDAFYTTYIESLRRTFIDTRDGRLIEAGQSLLDISDWLLGHAGDLGLTKDEQELQSERLKLWNDFNTCWLAFLQRQKDITLEMLESGQPPPPPQSILQEDFLERMGREIVRLCDSMERHGLVDYQMGVWEEEIISVLEDCLKLLEGDEDDMPEGASSAQDVPSNLNPNA